MRPDGPDGPWTLAAFVMVVVVVAFALALLVLEIGQAIELLVR